MKETTSKAHMQVHTNKESREKQLGKKPGPKRAWAFRAQFGAPFDLAASRAISSPMAESHKDIHSSSAAGEQRRERHHFEEEMVD
jgi:hypothetical protein